MSILQHCNTEVELNNVPRKEDRHVRAKGVWEYLGIGRSSFYALQNPNCKQFDVTFPAPYQISKRSKVWSLAEVAEWVRQREVKKYEGGSQ